MFNQKQMMNQIKKMQESVIKIQEELKNEKVDGKSGDGKVTITLNGHSEVLSVKLDPSLLNPEDAEMLEDLLVLAFRDGSEKARELSVKRLGPLTGGMNIPGLF
ncbi:MAG: YbaB/EbfC family nucleoid-associated protein [Firmicutes bacterium]|jgi:DNA-binding YbaB/EbfC family protein|nr:YbaB/EbfC family nucleoid-associated protein [Bacillota bacterium]